MNNLIAQNESLTMTTKEIADLIHKNHSDIKRSALRLESNNLLTQPLAELDFMHKGNIYHMYKLNKRDSILLVAQNCPEFTAAIIDRWQELENEQSPVLPDFNNAVLMARTWADDQEAKQAQAKQLELQAPKVAFVDRFIESTGNKSFREVAKILKANEREFRAFLYDAKVMYQLGGGWTAHANHIDAGRFYVTGGESNGHAYTTCKFTPKGIEYIAGKWIAHIN